MAFPEHFDDGKYIFVNELNVSPYMFRLLTMVVIQWIWVVMQRKKGTKKDEGKRSTRFLHDQPKKLFKSQRKTLSWKRWIYNDEFGGMDVIKSYK